MSATGVLATVLAVGCADPRPRPTGKADTDCASAASQADDARTTLDYAENFTVDYQDGLKHVRVLRPWRGSRFSLHYILVPCGRGVPADVDADAVFELPPKRLITTSSTQLPHVEALGLEDQLIGHDRFDYVTSPVLRQRIDSGRMTAVGDGVRLNTEILLDLRPDLVFVYSIGSPELDLPSSLRDAGIPFAIDAAWVEATPLARAEWLKYTAVFFDREQEADLLFDEIAHHYQELAALVRDVEHRPTVLTGAPFRGTWHVSGGRSFQARFIADAGGEYLWKDDDSPGSIPLDLESVYARSLEAEVWVHPSDWRSLDDALRADPRMADFRAFREGRVYNNDRRMNELGGNDYWESGSLRPDRVLADFIWILHPDLLPNHKPVFHRRLPQHRRDRRAAATAVESSTTQ